MTRTTLFTALLAVCAWLTVPSAVWITLVFAEGRVFGWTLTVCLLPYVLPDMLKLAAAIAVSRRLAKLV